MARRREDQWISGSASADTVLYLRHLSWIKGRETRSWIASLGREDCLQSPMNRAAGSAKNRGFGGLTAV